MDDEKRLSNLKQKVADLKTDLAIKKDRKEKLLESLEEHNISSPKAATAVLRSITKEIDKNEALRSEELDKAEAYLERYDV